MTLRVALVGGPMYDDLYARLADASDHDVEIVVHADHPTLNREVAERLDAGERLDVLREGLEEAGGIVRRFPRLIEKAELAAAMVGGEGLRLHPDSARAIAAEQDRRRRPTRVLLWIAAGLLVALLAT